MGRTRHGVLGLAFVAISAVLVGFASLAFACTGSTLLTLTPQQAPAGALVHGSGQSFTGSASGQAPPVVVRFNSFSGPVLWSGQPDASGNFSFSFSVPQAAVGNYVLIATQADASGKPEPGTPARAQLQVQAPFAKAVPAPSGPTAATTSTGTQPAASGHQASAAHPASSPRPAPAPTPSPAPRAASPAPPAPLASHAVSAPTPGAIQGRPASSASPSPAPSAAHGTVASAGASPVRPAATRARPAPAKPASSPAPAPAASPTNASTRTASAPTASPAASAAAPMAHRGTAPLGPTGFVPGGAQGAAKSPASPSGSYGLAAVLAGLSLATLVLIGLATASVLDSVPARKVLVRVRARRR